MYKSDCDIPLGDLHGRGLLSKHRVYTGTLVPGSMFLNVSIIACSYMYPSLPVLVYIEQKLSILGRDGRAAEVS